METLAFSQVATPFHVPASVDEGSGFPVSSPTLVIPFLKIAILMGLNTASLSQGREWRLREVE